MNRSIPDRSCIIKKLILLIPFVVVNACQPVAELPLSSAPTELTAQFLDDDISTPTDVIMQPLPLVTSTAAYDDYPTLAPGSRLVTPGPEKEKMISLAKEKLAQKFSLPADEIKVFSVLAFEWPDASLGCPQAGVSYADVITPGYQIALEWNRSIYTFHTDTTEKAVLCHVQPPHEIYSEP